MVQDGLDQTIVAMQPTIVQTAHTFHITDHNIDGAVLQEVLDTLTRPTAARRDERGAQASICHVHLHTCM